MTPPALKPLVIILPFLLLLGGVLMFVFLPLDLWLRVLILVSEVVAAAIVGVVLWRGPRS